MYTKIQVVFDAAEPEKLAEFWELALGYVAEPPPEDFDSASFRSRRTRCLPDRAA